MKGSTLRYASQHGLLQRAGELAYLKAIALDRTPEPFRKLIVDRPRLVVPLGRPKTVKEIAMAAVARG